jgi:hypothetical protein
MVHICVGGVTAMVHICVGGDYIEHICVGSGYMVLRGWVQQWYHDVL